MNAAGIDVSSRKSTVAVLRPFGEVVRLPFDVAHNTEGLASLAEQLKALDGETRVVLEHTGRYYEPVYQFLDHKRSEGKPFYVYMTAASNKFLRRYYAQVRDYLSTLDDLPPVDMDSTGLKTSD